MLQAIQLAKACGFAVAHSRTPQVTTPGFDTGGRREGAPSPVATVPASSGAPSWGPPLLDAPPDPGPSEVPVAPSSGSGDASARGARSSPAPHAKVAVPPRIGSVMRTT